MTRESLELAIDQVRTGNRLFDVCGTVEQHVKANGFSIVREYVGHGIGTQLHEEPQVPNYVDRKNENPRLKEGMVLAVEPMVNAGRPEAVVLKDKWTAVTKDGSYQRPFRALHRGDGERAVGSDEAVNGGRRWRRWWWKSGRAPCYERGVGERSRRFWPTWWAR